MKLYLSIIVCICIPNISFADGIRDGFEIDNQEEFNGSSSLKWIGDVNDFIITSSGWPTSPAPDFLGDHSIRAKKNETLNSTIITDISDEFSPKLKMRWEVFVSGKSTVVTSTRGFSLILFVDSMHTDSIESGLVNGYRIHAYDPKSRAYADGFYFEKASGSGWEMIDYVETPSALKLNKGWTIAVERDSSGIWKWGYGNGAYNNEVLLEKTTPDNTFTNGIYSGMQWYSIASYSNSFGFDNFSLDPYTPNLWSENAKSSDWNSNTNWDDLKVPDSLAQIKIETGNYYPVINSEVICHSMTLEPGASIRIDSAGSLKIRKNLILESDSSGTASLLSDGELFVEGESKIQCYLKTYDITNPNEYHFISSPVVDHIVEETFRHYYVYPYREKDNTWFALQQGDTIKKGKGYAIYYSGNSDHTIVFNGPFNSGNQIIDINCSNFSADSSKDNWNFIGNPFPSAIDWDLINKDVVESAIYVWNPKLNTYSSYVNGVGINFNDEGIIPAMQGFFVHAKSSGNIIIPDSARVLNTGYNLKFQKIKKPELRIIVHDSLYEDECKLYIDKNASLNWNPELDAYKLGFGQENNIRIGFGLDQKLLGIKAISLKKDSLVIPLNIQTDTSLFLYMDFMPDHAFVREIDIELLDKYNNHKYLPMSDTSFKLWIHPDEKNRFHLIMKRKIRDVSTYNLFDEVKVFIKKNGIIELIDLYGKLKDTHLEVIDRSGKIINQFKLYDSPVFSFRIRNSGIYILRIKLNHKYYSKKICVVC